MLLSIIIEQILDIFLELLEVLLFVGRICILFSYRQVISWCPWLGPSAATKLDRVLDVPKLYLDLLLELFELIFDGLEFLI